ncbi:MAG TPA: hypothetical protein VFW64_11770 [Pseudonocardiaceae bacterium]|nr:hypothetical protein [Pseudonocardiaceae bacterium]
MPTAPFRVRGGRHTVREEFAERMADTVHALRPTRALSGHHTPIAGLFVTSAGTAPGGGIAVAVADCGS